MTEDRTFQESNLCSLGPRPQIMTGLFITELRKHFSSADNIEHDVFRERLFTQTTATATTASDTTGILIEDATVWTPTRTQNRPAIVVKRNAWKHLKRLTMANSGVDSDGNTQHVKFWRGSHTMFCIAPNGGEAETLAAETYRFLMHWGPFMRKYFSLLLFELVDVGPVTIVKEASNHYAVPITVAYGWSEQWTIRKHVPPLEDLRLSQLFQTYRDAEDT